MKKPKKVTLAPVDTFKRIVDDPYASAGQSTKVEATATMRDDPLGRLFARRQIQPHQFEVGRYVQGLFEAATIGSVQAFDPTREAVDGRGAYVEPITDSQRDAVNRLKQARERLGDRGYALVRDVLSDRMFMADIARRTGERGDKALYFLGRRFREALEDLTYVYGFAGAAPARRAPRDEFSRTAKHANNPKLRTAINLARELNEAA